MKNEQNILLMKEKLKEKDRAIFKLQSSKDEWESRVKQKITEMTGVIEEQKRIIDSTGKERSDGGKPAAESQGDQDSALLVKLEKQKSKNGSLKKENGELSKDLKDSKDNIKKLNQKISALVKEYKRLKESQKTKIKDLINKLETGEKSQGEINEGLKNAYEEKDKIQAELNELKQKSENQSENPNDNGKIEALVKIKEGLETELVNLSKSLEEWRNKAENLENERTGLTELADEFQEEGGASGGENITGVLKKQIIKQKEEAEAQKKKAETLIKQIEALKQQVDDKAPVAPMKPPEEEESGGEEGGAPAWMCTFADMVTLLMVFFIIFYSVNADNTAKMLSVIKGTEDKSVAIGVLEALDEITIKENLNDLVGLGPGKGQFEFQVEAELKKDLEKAKIEGADVGRNGKKIHVNVPANSLFKPGSADLSKQAIPILNKLSLAFLKFTDYQINIAGHTDDVPISTARFPSNWELSSSRATSVLRFFADKGIDPLKMTATGRSDLFPLYSNSTEIGRSKNRRVEFVLEKEKKG